MKLFKITDPNGGGYNRFNGAVVIAPDEDSARHMHPDVDDHEYWSPRLGWIKPWYALKEDHQETFKLSIQGRFDDFQKIAEVESFWRDSSGRHWTTGMSYWPNPSAVTVEYLGESNEEHPRVVLADFHHG